MSRRIGVLEWASCGAQGNPALLPPSIRTEGWAMCQSVLTSLAQAGYDACSIVWSDLWHQASRQAGLRCLDPAQDIHQQWHSMFAACDATIVIAPESDRVLSELLHRGRQQGWKLINGDDQFTLATSDKWVTAQLLRSAGVPHPPTYLLSELKLDQLNTSEHATWVFKPRDGVGCEGLERVAARDLHAACQRYRPQAERWLLQPWLPGRAYSRSMIADIHGQYHWLPVTQQTLALDARVAYLGGRIEPDCPLNGPEPTARLTTAVQAMGGQALGWVGVDFIWDAGHLSAVPIVVEINPRLTTSFVGLSASFPHLAAMLVAALYGHQITLPQHWQAVRFDLAAQTAAIAL